MRANIETRQKEAYELPMVLPETIFPELKVIIEKAEENAPHILMRLESVEEAEGNRKASGSRQLPQISGLMQLMQLRQKRQDEDETSRKNLMKPALTLRQAIFYWGDITAEKRMGELRAKLSKMDYERGKEFLVKEIRRVYLEIYSQKIAQKIAEENLVIAQKQWNDVQNKHALKMATEQQKEETGLHLESIEIYLEQTLAALAQNLTYLYDLIGEEASILESPKSPSALKTEWDKHTTSVYLSAGLPYSAQYNYLEYLLEIEKNNLTRIQSQQLPRVDLTAGYFKDQVDGVSRSDSVQRDNYHVGIEVNWSIFDGFRTQGQRIASKSRQRRLKIELREEENKTRREVSRLIQGLNLSKRMINLQERRFNIARQKLNTKEQLLAQEAINHTDYLEAKRHLDETEFHLANLIKDYFNQLSDYLIYTRNPKLVSQLK